LKNFLNNSIIRYLEVQKGGKSMDISFFKSKKFIFILAGIIIISIALTVLFGRKTINIENVGELTIWFNRMTEEQVTDLYKKGKDLIDRKDPDTLENIREIISKYGGDLSYYDPLLGCHLMLSRGEDRPALNVILDIYEDKGSLQFLENAGEVDLFINLLKKLTVDSKVVPLEDIVGGINALMTFDKKEGENLKEVLMVRLDEVRGLKEKGRYTKDKVYILREDAVKDAKSEGLFMAKKSAPEKLLGSIKNIVDFGSLVNDDKILKYIRDNIICKASVGSVKRVPLNEDLTQSDEEEDMEEVEMGWIAEVEYTAELKSFSISKILEFAEVDLFEN
jgi:hypothetical protein